MPIERRMPISDPGTIVRVPFPYTDRPVVQRRPALVLSTSAFAARHGLVWVVMVTSARNLGWQGDVMIADHLAAGLPSPSTIRTAKVATIHLADTEPIGRLDSGTLAEVQRAVADQLGLWAK